MRPETVLPDRAIDCRSRLFRTPSGPSFHPAVLGWIGLTCLLLLVWSGESAANVRVNQDGPGQIQNSPSLGLDPFWSSIVVGYVDTPGSGSGVGASYRSLAGGNWIDSAFPAFGWHGWEQDPSVASDGLGLTFLCQASYNQRPPSPLNPGGLPTTSAIYVSVSTDGGQSFGTPSQVSLQTGTLPREMKPKIEVDDFINPPSPYAGQAYVAWQRDLNTQPPASDAYLSLSTDGGMTWSVPAAKLNSNPALNQVHSPDLAVGSDGSVVAAWVNTPTWIQQQGQLLPQQGQVWVTRSTDGGATFNPEVAAATLWSVPQMLTDGQNPPQGSYAAESYASVEVDPSNPNRIGIVYAADPDDGPAAETRVDFTDLPPGTADASLISPFHGGSNLSCNRSSPNYVYSVWIDSRAGSDVYFSRGQIVNGIANWTGDVRLSNLPAGEHVGSQRATVVSSGSNVYVVWDEWVGVDFVHLIYFNRSTDYGATWLPQAINLDTQMQVTYAGNPSISCDGNNVCVVWEVGRDATHSDVYSNYSTDGGLTWQATEIPVRTGQWITRPQVAQTMNYVYAVWEEAFGAGATMDIYVSVSSNYGASWSAPIRLNFNDPIGASISYAPKICCSNTGGVYVVWDDKRVNGVANPYFAYSNSFGSVWQGDIRLNTGIAAGMSRDYYAQMACDGSYVAVVWESDRSNLGVQDDVYLNFSTDGGATWLASDVPQDTGSPPGADASAYPRVSVYDYGYPNDVYIYTTWIDDRNSQTGFNGWDVYGTYGTYNPASGAWWWLGWDYRIDGTDQPGANDSWYPQVASDWSGPYYLYGDDRNGQTDVYANQYRTGPDEGDIFYVESTDAGQTWSSPLRVNDDATTNDQTHCWLDIKPNGIVDVGWLDKRNDVPMDQNADEYFASLMPGAVAFNANVPITNQPIVAPLGGNWWIGDYTWVDVSATDAHLAWTDTRRGGDGLLGDAFYDVRANPSFGACCLPGGACVMRSASACASEGGTFEGEGTLCDPNPCGQEDHSDHDVGNCILTVTDMGIIGFLDGTQEVGSGFIYPRDRQGVNQLYIGSLWVGTGPDYIANRDYDADPNREWVVSTDPDGHIWVDESGWISGDGDSDQDIHAGFTDELAGEPRDLYVEQVTWAYGAPEAADDFVIMNYAIQNRGPETLADLYVGLFLDFDLDPTVDDDEGAVDVERRLVYMTDPTGIHTGVVILDPDGVPAPVANLTLVDNPTYVWPNGYILDLDKDAFLSAADSDHVLTESPGPNDYSVLASVGPFTLLPGEVQSVSFGIVGGASLDEIVQNASVCQRIASQGITDAPEPPSLPAARTQLLPSAPNPFSAGTTIRFDLAEAQQTRVTLHDVSGRRVRLLAEGQRPAGRHVLTWDGRDGAGRPVAAGIYFVRLRAGGETRSRPVVRMP